jgi:hypothetical protein
MTGRFLLCHTALWQSPAVLLFARHKNCSTSSPSRGETRFSFGGIPYDDDDLRVAQVAAAQHRSKPPHGAGSPQVSSYLSAGCRPSHGR